MFILGTERISSTNKLQSRLTFRNPNEKGRCGCGESFPRLIEPHLIEPIC